MRFAPLIRVSTEAQAKKGESLETQRKQIISAVEMLGGRIPANCWKYSGQEHATPDQERAKMDMLLLDSGKDIFDAIIVADTSRWSRDNLKSKKGLKILRANGIRFFVLTSEYDLSSPEHNLFLGMAAEIGEYQARMQTLKSLHNRIERAKKGWHSGGRLPYGRLFDKETKKWSLNKEQAEKIRWAAEQ